MTDRCEPPEEARGERWHTLSAEGFTTAETDRVPFPAEWIDGMWKSDGCFAISPEKAARCGFRWLAVAKPPEGA